jgi:DNA-binding beta-propeller fold protein YncE
LWARNGIDVFVADYGNHRIQRFDRHLSYIATLSTRDSPNPDERFGYPTDVTVSRLGDLFICDSENSRIVKVNRFTQVERTFGGFGAGEGRLLNPTCVEIGPSDHVYVIDGSRVVVFDNSGNYLRTISGVFRPPLLLYANSVSVAIVDSTSLYCLDTDERPACSLPIQTATGMQRNQIQSIAFQQDSMFILTGTGVIALPDPPAMMFEK